MAIDGRYVELLDGSGIDRDEAGGKAWALDRLVEMGFRVPPAFVVRASAYRRFTAEEPIEALLEDLGSRPIPPAAESAAAETRIEAAFLAHPIPADVVAELRDAVLPVLSAGSVAVRSSATAEDMADRSFAGQYRSYLDVATMDEVLDAVRRCWASLWFPAARSYRRHVGIADEGLAMAVILQHQVPAEWSGVMFTRDPQGDGSTLRIESVPGLGEHLVAGHVTPADFVVDRRSLALVARRREPPPFLEDVARLGLRVEWRMGEPQDVEWSIAGGRLWVLQARPITVGTPLARDDDGFDTDAFADDLFTPQGVGEMLPGVIPPLVWTINRPMVEEAFRRMFARLGAATPERHRAIVARFRGRAALNLSALREAAASLPSGSADEIDAAYLGPDRAGAPLSQEASHGRASVRVLIRNWRAQRRVEDEVRVLCTAVACLSIIEPDPAELTLDRLLAYRRELRDLAWRGIAAELAASSAAGSAYHSLEMLLSRWLGDVRGTQAAQRVTSGTLSRAMVGPNRVSRLRTVVSEHGTPAFARVMSGAAAATVRAKLVQAGGAALVDALEEEAKRFGSVSLYGGRTFAEEPDHMWQLVLAATSDSSRAVDRPEDATAVLIDALDSDRRWRVLRVLSGQLVDLRKRLLLRMTGDAVRFLTLREEAKGALLALGGMERRVILDGAKRLVRSGLLARAADVELLSDVEFEEMLAGGGPVTRLELARRAAAHAVARDGDPLPPSFVGNPSAVVPIGGDSETLQGWAASAGVVRGRVRRIRDLDDGDVLEQGEIIVAIATDPSWTPLFLRAGGIVLEQGGPLSHAAIVAREMALPAVLNVADATRKLEDGVLVEVDGTHGVVHVVAPQHVGSGAAV